MMATARKTETENRAISQFLREDVSLGKKGERKRRETMEKSRCRMSDIIDLTNKSSQAA